MPKESFGSDFEGPERPHGENVPQAPRFENDEDRRRREILNDLIGRLDGMYRDIRKLKPLHHYEEWRTTVPDAVSCCCLAAQELLEELRDEMDGFPGKSLEDHQYDVRLHLQGAIDTLKSRGDRRIVDTSGEAVREEPQ